MDLLLSSSYGFGYERILNFSWRHDLHLFVMFQYGATDFQMCHFNVGVTLGLGFKSQAYFAAWCRSFLTLSWKTYYDWKTVLNSPFAFLKQTLLWKPVAGKPEAIHLQTTSLARHSASNGHFSFFLQLHGNVNWLLERISFLLCDFMILPKFCVQQ